MLGLSGTCAFHATSKELLNVTLSSDYSYFNSFKVVLLILTHLKTHRLQAMVLSLGWLSDCRRMPGSKSKPCNSHISRGLGLHMIADL